ncbi:HAMP domain-containing histidine kinase, partial [Microbacterium maritypicum]|uniref:histidine kinase dimerization/phospho-acceptor domain-containing protein n=1 Tax=Microbacterium maritypicum TaxID=33918 RepID=UPI003D6EFC88
MRGRTTLGATVVVAVALLIGAFSFYGVLSASIHGSTERAAEQRLEELTERAGGPGGKDIDALDDEILQIIGADGSVRAASEDAREKLGSTPLPVDDDPQTTTVDGETVLVVSEDIERDQTLVLAVSMEDDAETLATVATLLAIALPLLLLLVAVTTWSVVGRALRPVELIREEVDGITAERLHQRVPVPETADEIAALATTMNGMLDRLDAAATAQRRFVSDASHELRSPLATIRQHAELAQAHPDVTSIGELAEVVSEEGLRLQGIVESLLLLARLDEGASTHDEAVDLDDIALGEVRRLRAAGIDVDGSGIHAARVHGDPRLLGQLVRNLADNA